MTTTDARELDARVAEKVMGKRVDPDDCGCTDCLTGESLHPGQVPDYLTDASADYEVLRHVRETWDARRLRRFSANLQAMWFDRQRDADESYPVVAYLPGDYARAALAVMEGE